MFKKPKNNTQDKNSTSASIVIVFSLFLALSSFLLTRYLPLFFSFEHKLADIRTANYSPQNESQVARVHFLKITEHELKEMTYRSPIDRAWLANLVETIDQRNPKVIALQILFDQPTEKDKDQKLINVLKTAKAEIVLASADSRLELDPLQKEYNEFFLQETGRPHGFVNLEKDLDDVTRLLPRPVDKNRPISFADMAASLYLAKSLPLVQKNEQISWLRDVKKGEHAITESAASFIRDQPNIDLAGKIILIGQDVPYLDRHKTPFNNWGSFENGMAGSKVMSQIIVQRLDGRRLKLLHPMLEFLLYFLSALLGWKIAVGTVLSRHQNILLPLLGILLIALDMLTFKAFSTILPAAMVIVTITAASTLAKYRNRLANRKEQKV